MTISGRIMSTPASRAPSLASMGLRSQYHQAYSLWLFTYSDLKTIVGPKTTFGLCSSLSAEIFGVSPKSTRLILARTPLILLWTWINLLPFAIDNQRQPLAIDEDGINKPWRPMPSGRVSPQQAKRWMLGLYPAAIVFSFCFGGLRQCVVLILLGLWYNDLSGADKNPMIRNFINACGFLCYTSGAMEVAYGDVLHLTWDSLLLRWLGFIGAVVASSVHIQDMYDQAGDRIRGRKTLPLVIGHWPSRLSIAAAVLFWSYFGLRFWNIGWPAYVPLVGLGGAVSIRTMTRRTVSDDKTTFKLWNLWLVVLYSIPLVKFWSGGAI